jgi:hypothetical protein
MLIRRWGKLVKVQCNARFFICFTQPKFFKKSLASERAFDIFSAPFRPKD